MVTSVTNEESKTGSTPHTVNLLDVVANESMEQTHDLVRLGYDEIAIIPFTAEGQKVDIHYCPETEINSYVVCNGPDCVLCRIGRKRDQRMLLPVYVPAAGCVGNHKVFHFCSDNVDSFQDLAGFDVTDQIALTG